MNEKLELEQITQMREDTLTRLEWRSIALFLSHFATFTHTKEILKLLSPWNFLSMENDLNEKNIEFYKNATKEIFLFIEKGSQLTLENFDLENFEKPLKRGALLSANGLYQIAIVLKLSGIIQLFAKTNNIEEASFPNLFAVFKNLKTHHSLLQRLFKSVNDQGDILPNASEELALAHKNFAHAKRKITENLEHILKTNSVKNAVQDTTWMLKDGRYVLPVRIDRKNDIEGIARGISQTGSTIFIEPKILANEQAALEKAQLDIQVEEYKIIKSLSEACYLVANDILHTAETLTLIDEIYARAQFASMLSANPCVFLGQTLAEQTFGTNFKFSFQNARHPLFVFEKKNCVANHIELAQANVLVLSGPNAGGKTVVLKTIGVFALMAKCGLFLPCEKPQCLDYENVFVLLGDRQSREEDLSTFSGHLEQIKKIISVANEKTLILLDEGFVGTDPAVGVALARAVLEFLAHKQATVIITTHFSSLKTLANDDARFSNASMEFESKNLRPTYKLLNGIPGQSYALELCERMQLNPYIISEARKYYGTEAQRMENILQELQERKIELNEELNYQKELSLQLQQELEKIQQEQKSLIEMKASLVEYYRTKLTKRFNAFSNRLEIRERQYHKQLALQQQAVVLENAVPVVENATPAVIAKEKLNDNKKTYQDEKSKKGDKFTSFEELAKLKLESFPRSSNPNVDTLTKYRQPKQMTQRALIDEAQESLDVLNKSFDRIEENLTDDLNTALKINLESKQKAKNLNTVLSLQTKTNKSADFWKEGVRIKTDNFKEVGYVLKSVDNKGLVECQFGLMKTKIHHTKLMTIEEAALKSETSSKLNKNIIQNKTKNYKIQAKHHNVTNHEIPQVLPHSGNTLDLRGKTVDEAISRLELMLDKMWRSDILQVVIIHGHGLGKVKEAVRKYLETSSYELSFRPGRQGEGGDGVTVVEFEN